MRFESRELTPHARSVRPGDLVVGAIYFSVQFLDADMLVPELQPLVYLGSDLTPGDPGTLYFQDAASYRRGIRFNSAESDEAVFFAQGPNEVNHIFEYEHALDLLLMCSLRRDQWHRSGG